MKKVLSIVLLIAIMCSMALGLTACNSHEGQVQIAGAWVDKGNVDKISNSIKKAQAADKGDSYCKKCNRFIEGKVRICPNCGQYI